MLNHKALYSLCLSLGTIVILLFSLMLIAPVSGAYLTWKATTAPNTLAMRSDTGKEKRTAATVTPEPTLQPTQIIEPKNTQAPPPILLIPATVVEIDLMGVGLYDKIHNTFEVTGEACVRNSGANVTDGISPLQLQVLGLDGNQNTVSISAQELVIDGVLAPGTKRCFNYRLPVTPDGKSDFVIAGSVTINNFEGWLPGTGNCPQQIPCPYGPNANVRFTLPTVTTVPTAVIETLPPPPATAEPTQIPTEAIIEPAPVPTEAPPPPVVEPTAIPPAPTEEPIIEPTTAPVEEVTAVPDVPSQP